MIFYTYTDRFDRKVSGSKKAPKEVFSDCGEPIGITYEYRTKEGIKSLVPYGKVDRQELIESYADDCDIVKKIQKFLNGEIDIANPNSGIYGDFTNVPTSYADMFDRVQQCEKVFDSMPAEIKAEFDNSSESFWTQFGTDRFNDVFNKYNNIESNNNDSNVNGSEVKDSAE